MKFEFLLLLIIIAAFYPLTHTDTHALAAFARFHRLTIRKILNKYENGIYLIIQFDQKSLFLLD